MNRGDAAAATWIFRGDESLRLRDGSSAAVGRADEARKRGKAAARLVRKAREGRAGDENATMAKIEADLAKLNAEL